MTDKPRDAEREAFETAYTAAYPFAASALGKFDRDQDGYADVSVAVGWRMWQAALAQQDAQAVPPQQDLKILMNRLENQAHRAGELWERCQGKSWPEKESAEFAALRDVKMPQTRAALAARLNAAPTPPAQQDAQVVQEPCAVVKWQTGGPVVHIIGDVQAGDLLYRAAPTPPAQQDAQAVAQDEIVAAWKSGMTVQYFVTIGHDDEWTDYTNPTPPDTSGTRLAWRVKPGQRSNAAPTPPAQRVMLTDDEIEDLTRGKSGHSDFARAVIEAYERKNGIK